MPRTDYKLMEGWEFTLDADGKKGYRPVTLPHDWAISAPFCRDMDQGEAQGFRDRFGIGWYRRSLRLEEKKEGYCYYLDFGGIFENSTIWVNEREAGGWKYGYSSFRLDITQFLKTGENSIVIRVDNTASPADRWYSGAGIYRTVKLLETEAAHLEEREIVVHTELEGDSAVVRVAAGVDARVRGSLSLAGVCGDAQNNRCPDAENMAEGILAEDIIAEGENGLLEFHVKNASLWSAEEPNLYTLTLSLMDGERAADTVSMRIGLRKIELLPGKGMFVNGEKVILKGVCLHQEAGSAGIAAKKEIWRERLLLLKEMGCNSIRAAHHTHSVEFLDLCDELGFYVYEECFDKWTGGLYGRYFETEWKKDVEAMVKRDRNRACIFIWGVGNEVENQGQPSMLAILKMLKDYVLTMDATRPVTYAMNPHFKRESNVELSQIKDIQKFVDEADDTEIYDVRERVERICRIGEIVDVISCNYQEQWYPMIHEAMPDKLILGTEIYQFFKGHPEQMQNFTNENPSLVPFAADYVIGGMIWTGIDYLGESMGYPAKGWSGAMIRTNLVKKPGFYLLKSYWNEEPMVHFSVMDYSLEDEGVKEHWDMPIYADHWHFPQFHKTVIPYMIASNCEEVALYLNGKRFFLPRPADCPNRMITGFLPYQPGCVKAVGYKNGEEVCCHVLKTPGPSVRLSFTREEIKAPAERGYEMLLTVRAEDEEGNPYFRESSRVRFQIEGDGEILSVDNGNLMTNEPYQADFIHMYHGCASVRIRLGGSAGRIVVSACAEGMYPGKTVLTVE